MNKSVLFGAMTVASLAAGAAAAGTLEDVQARGKLNCGVTTGLVGFAAPDANGEWKGFDVAVCRAVAAAVLGDGNAKLNSSQQLARHASQRLLLAKSTCWHVTQHGHCLAMLT